MYVIDAFVVMVRYHYNAQVKWSIRAQRPVRPLPQREYLLVSMSNFQGTCTDKEAPSAASEFVLTDSSMSRL
jgi:hypothetical protein